MPTPHRPARRVEVARLVPVEASVAFAWVADPRTHPRWIPLTRMASPVPPEPVEGSPRGPESGDRITMVSGPGVGLAGDGRLRGLLARAAVTDSMVIESIERPSTSASRVGRTRLRKLGPVLLGDAGFDVVPVDADRCRVVWWEEAYLAEGAAGPLPRRLTDPLVRLGLGAMMRVSLARLARRLAGRGR
ncbi:hypothetical protein GCM10009809_28730 [Isoptericola hypogeus]|uniref:Polyketide cyclase / dehydrase and lipid transport n=1 Tax=Isoptericola hypogeus TaxID=300179 RepID=A0ABP4VP46_9MICO